MGTTCRTDPAIPGAATVYGIKGALRRMMKLRLVVRRLGETDCDSPDVWRDPLSHPALRSMSERQLADLPFSAPPGRKR